jgi:hypothetical protein
VDAEQAAQVVEVEEQVLALAALAGLEKVWEGQPELVTVWAVQEQVFVVWVPLSSESAISAGLMKSVVSPALETGLVASMGQERQE